MTTEVKAFEQNGTASDNASSADELKTIDQKITDTQIEISRCSAEIDPRRVGTFRYFWPFLVVSLVGSFFGLIYMSLSNFIYQAKMAEGVANEESPLGLIFLVIVVGFLILHIGGGVYARNKCDKVNAEFNHRDTEKRAELKKYEEQLLKLNLSKKAYLEASANKSFAATQKEIPEDIAAAITTKKNQIKLNENAIAESNSKLVQINSGVVARKRTSMSYFWPFLVISLAGSFQLRYLCYMFLPMSYSESDEWIALIIIAHFFILLHVFGGIFARKMTDKYNSVSDSQNSARFEEAEKVRAELTDLEYKRRQLYEELRSYEESVQRS